MKWIKYQIVCGKNQNEENILINKKVGYSAENIAIAEKEAYNGYTIEEDAESFDKEPLAIELGGTHANNADDARKNLGAFAAADYDGLIVKTGNPVQANLKQGRGISAITTMLPLQSGSGDPSPSNIRPISGWTGARLTRFVKNLFDKDSAMLNSWYAYSSDNANANPFNGLFASKLIPVQPGEVFTLTNYLTDAGVALVKYLVSETNTGGIESIRSGNVITCDGTKQVYTFTVPDKVRYIGITGDMANIDKVQLELGSAATEYEPYQGDTYTADFGQTVYGGTLDWQTGVLTVDKAMITLTGAESYMAFGSDYPNLFVLLPGTIQQNGVQLPHEQNICSHYKSHASRFDENSWYLDAVGVQAFFNDMRITNVNDFASYITAQYAAGTPVQICYKLATPTTIQLTPQEMIEALDGLNTVYTDCGSNDVTFNHDLPLLNAVPKPTPESIGAAPANHTHTPESIGAAKSNHTHADFAYSEAEVNTGKTWIGGKPIYKKTIAITSTISAPAGVTMKVVGAILDIDVPIKIYGAVAYHSDNAPYTWYQLGSHVDLEDKMWTGSTIDVATGQVKLYVSNLTIGSGYVTVEYTKKTN